MTRNPLRARKYDVQEFHVWNWAVRRSINEYDKSQSNIKPVRRWNDIGEQICAHKDCPVRINHVRSRLCESHRRESYNSTKRRR